MTSIKQMRPLYGQRLLPRLLDELSKSTPERLYASYPYSAEISQGYRDVTFLDMARATNYFSWWIEERFGRSSEFETLSFVGIPDLRTAIIFLASIKCGYKLLLLSQRNAIPIDVSLLQQTNCSKVMLSGEMRPIINGVQTSLKSLECVEVPSLEEIVDAESEDYPYEETFEKAKQNPIVILHSSGSTGVPKPITMTHGTFATIDNDRNLPSIKGRRNGDATLWDFPEGGRFFSPFPPSHLAGFTAVSVRPIYSEASAPVFGPALRPVDGALLWEIMQQQRLRALYLPPAIAEQLLQQPGGVKNFEGLDFLCYAGGPLATAAGDRISKVTDICQIYGGTETGQIHQIFPSRDDWGYMEWHPAESLTMEPAEDDAYELVMDINDESEGRSHLNHNFPGLTRYRTKDLFRAHPTKPNLWRFHGRTDDIIVLSNGEKFNPVPMEVSIQGQPEVLGALVIGQGRFQAALLVEAKPEVMDRVSLIERIWPLVEQGNVQLPSQGRISRSKILIAGPDKPFQRAGKGTVVRKLTEKAFADDIEALYKEYDKAYRHNGPILESLHSLEALEGFVHAIVDSVFPGIEVNKYDDFFALGLDSLKSMEIATSLRIGLKSQIVAEEISWLTSNTVYRYPSIHQISAALSTFFDSGHVPEQKRHQPIEERNERMSALVDKYIKTLPQRSQQSRRQESDDFSVAITGATGSLGLHLLQRLMENPKVSRIYCLNRAANAQQRIEQKLRRCSGALDHSRLTYLTIILGEDSFGLTRLQYLDLAGSIDVILHNAWKVDFNIPLGAYEHDYIRGTRNIIDLCSIGERQPRIVFVSSVSSAGNWANVHGTDSLIPESPLKEFEVSSPMGYGESKNITENLLHVASQQAGIPVSILRLGQVAGSTKPEDPPWFEKEWFPSLIKTSKSLELLPDDLPDVDWIPIDLMADAIVEIVCFELASRDNERVYNVVNPRLASWSSLIETVRQHLGPQIKVVPIKQWLRALEQTEGIDKDQLSSKPALKILDFLDELRFQERAVKYDVQHCLEASRSMASLESVKPEWMKTWLDQWNF